MTRPATHSVVAPLTFALVMAGCAAPADTTEDGESVSSTDEGLTLGPPRVTSLDSSGLVVGFPGTVRAVGENLATVSWDFGDAAFPRTATGGAPRVVFRRDGIVPVRVTGKNGTGLSTTVTLDVKVANVVTSLAAPTASFPATNGSQPRIAARTDGRRVFAHVPRRLPDGTMPVELGVERADGTFAVTTVRPAGIDEVVDLRVAVGADNVPQLLVASATRLAYCRVQVSSPSCVDLGAWSGSFDLALRRDGRPVVSLCRGRWLAPDIGGLRVMVASTSAPSTAADFGREVIVDTRSYHLPVDLGTHHALALVEDRPVIIANNGLAPGRYPDGRWIVPVQAYEAVRDVPTGAGDFSVRDVDGAHTALTGSSARVVGDRLVVAGNAGGSLAVYSAPTSALGIGFRKVVVDDLAPSDAVASPYRVSLSAVGARPLLSYVDSRGTAHVAVALDNQPSDPTHLIRLGAFDATARYYTAVLGRGAGPAGLSLLVHRASGTLELVTAR
ncbi:MAG: PKD domain-containing protein [Myxococcales bacterium]|nr:PKD domain-containing protein [Myxococcales bacterium]